MKLLPSIAVCCVVTFFQRNEHVPLWFGRYNALMLLILMLLRIGTFQNWINCSSSKSFDFWTQFFSFLLWSIPFAKMSAIAAMIFRNCSYRTARTCFSTRRPISIDDSSDDESVGELVKIGDLVCLSFAQCLSIFFVVIKNTYLYIKLFLHLISIHLSQTRFWKLKFYFFYFANTIAMKIDCNDSSIANLTMFSLYLVFHI